MIMIDTLLKRREKNPIRVGMIGAGFMGQGIAYQIARTPGMKLVAICNRNIKKAHDAYIKSGVLDHKIKTVHDPTDADLEISNDNYCITTQYEAITQSESIDAIVEVTGSIEYATKAIEDALIQDKHVIMMNPEVDGTVGPALKEIADKKRVVLSNSDGDQPGVEINLYRFVKGIGIKPILCGNIRGFHNTYGNPSTQQWFADKWGQNVNMVTSFCDGTKVAFEQCIVANATNMGLFQKGMVAPNVDRGTFITQCLHKFPLESIKDTPGVVDYVLGAEPSPGIFVVGYCDDPFLRHYLNLFKMGEGPFYCFYRPYHLCFFEVPSSIARAVLLNDPVMEPLSYTPVLDVMAVAKKDLKAGEVLDSIGGYCLYGLLERSSVVRNGKILPIGIAQDCRVFKDIKKDEVLTYDDIELPEGRLCDFLRKRQDQTVVCEEK